MKLFNVVVGFIIFSTIVTMLFATAYDILDDEGVSDADTFNQLSGEYGTFADDFDNPGSVSRDIKSNVEQGKASSEDSDISIVGGALAGGRTALNFLSNFEKIVVNATVNANRDGETLIDNRITDAFLVILSVGLVLIALYFIRAFKMET